MRPPELAGRILKAGPVILFEGSIVMKVSYASVREIDSESRNVVVYRILLAILQSRQKIYSQIRMNREYILNYLTALVFFPLNSIFEKKI